MSRCNYCGLEILDKTEHCPLCHGVLENPMNGQRTYPDAVAERKKINFAFRLILFIAIVIACVCAAVNYFLMPDSRWSLMVTACLVYAVWMAYIIMKDNAGYRVRIITGVLGAVILVFLLDELLGYRGWSLNYVFPAAVIVMDVALVLLMVINARNWQSYLILQIATLLVSAVLLILCRVGVISNVIFSVVAFLITLVLFLGSMILGGKTAKNEMKRRFHI